jgi:hypothetical protein
VPLPECILPNDSLAAAVTGGHWQHCWGAWQSYMYYMAPECALEACLCAGVLWVDGAKEDAYRSISFFLKYGFVFFLSTSVLQNLMSLFTHTCIHCLLFHVLEQFPNLDIATVL